MGEPKCLAHQTFGPASCDQQIIRPSLAQPRPWARPPGRPMQGPNTHMCMNNITSAFTWTRSTLQLSYISDCILMTKFCAR